MAKRNIMEATETATFTELFTMGADSVSLIMDGYAFADGEYFATASLWNHTSESWVVVGTKRYTDSYQASEVFIKKYNLVGR